MEKIRVLMVDDEEQFRATTSKILTRRGYDTMVAASGEEAIAALKKTPRDVVILDIKMPGMSGVEALEKIKKIDPQVQVIMLTGHGGEETARESLKHGAFDYLSKPCDIDLLSARINDAYAGVHKLKGEEPRVRDIMIPIEDYTTISPDRPVKEGIKELVKSFEVNFSSSKLITKGHRSILVFKPGGDLVGVLSIFDLIRKLRPGYLSAPKPSTADWVQYSAMFWSGLFTKQAKDLANKKIGDIMSPPPPSIPDDSNLMDATNLLFETQSRRLVVMRKNKVVGVVREQEIFLCVANMIASS